MGASQSTSQTITNTLVSEMISRSTTQQSATNSGNLTNIVDFSGSTIRGDFNVDQEQEFEMDVETYISNTQTFVMDSEMTAALTQAVQQETANLTLSINSQDVNSTIMNEIINKQVVENAVRSSCENLVSLSNIIKARNATVLGDVNITQKQFGKLAAKCIMDNTGYAEMMAKVDAQIAQDSKQTVEDFLTGVLLVVIIGGVVAVAIKGAGDRQKLEAMAKSPRVAFQMFLPLLVCVIFLWGLDCAGKLPVYRIPILKIPIIPSACVEDVRRNSDGEIEIKHSVYGSVAWGLIIAIILFYVFLTLKEAHALSKARVDVIRNTPATATATASAISYFNK